MKIAWLIWSDGATIYPELRWTEPERYMYHRVQQIVYIDIKD